MKKLVYSLLLVLIAVVFAACSSPGNLVDYRADLSPANEVPPITTSDATGFVDFELDGNVLTIQDNAVEDLSSEPFVIGESAAHIHDGCADENGGVLFPITVSEEGDGGLEMSGSFDLDDAQLERLNADCLYVNVHTEEYNSGELRGQIDGLLE